MWEQFVENSNSCGKFSWKYIADLLPKEECYLFFNQIKCDKAYRFENAKGLYVVIGETYNCEVYVMDNKETYIIYFNHEMILSSCGRTRQRIDDFKNSKERYCGID